jgi:N-acetylglutamate synthase-like GNAT family acetyltransferase
MQCIKLIVNAYSQPRMKAFEDSARLSHAVSEVMLREINKPALADYYVVEQDGQWLGRLRLTAGGLNAVLVDALDVLPGPLETDVANLLLAQARSVAAQQNRLLAVVTPQPEPRWASYGFKPVESALALAA